ncbi:MAG: GNAT family N-acetyltransferase [Clostridium sp.]|nr:GNAT family N-acetyltransferase [Clostridium sp.]
MIRYAVPTDLETLKKHENHISERELASSINTQKILVMFHGDIFIGWLRYNLFWDNTPFMNMLYFLEEYRGKGYGKQLLNYWEEEMRKNHYKKALTSTLSNERAQFFYRKNGYVDCGCLMLPGEPLEIILMKNIDEQ